MEKIQTHAAPQALGPYSQAVKSGELIFVSGQLPINPETGKLLESDIGQQTKLVIQNLEAILKAGGSSLSQVVRCDVFLTNLDNFKLMNEEYSNHFQGDCPPARQTIQVAALPLGSPIEISCIALA